MATHNSLVLRNLMEDAVLRVVDEVCDEVEAADPTRYATAAECRMDAACYVLNRIQQRYVSSARGQAHTDEKIADDPQLFVDIVTLVHEALKRVTSVRRSFYGGPEASAAAVKGPSVFFPVIKGRLYDKSSFERMSDAEVRLLEDGELVPMLDSRWENPYAIARETAGTYLFWPAPRARPAGRTHRIELAVRIRKAGYRTLTHSFALSLTAVPPMPDSLEITGDHRLPDLYLAPSRR